MRTLRASPGEAGFSLVELLVAVFVMIVGILGVVALVDGANRTTADNRAREAATNLTRELIEDARSIPYAGLEPVGLASTLASLSGGTVQSGSIVYERRGTTYTSTPSLCYVDDPKDGYGSHAGGAYCGDATASDDSFALDYKRFTVVTTWSGPRGTGTSRQTAVINDPGSSFAPQITEFSMTAPTTCTGDPACAQVDSGPGLTASFSVTTSRPAATVNWYVNDLKMGTATGSGTGPWNFTWDLTAVATGSYTISVRANSGKDGAVRSLVIPVKESPVQAPTSPFGGINQHWSNVVELNWTPLAASVLGYDVERLVGGVWSTVDCYDEKGVTLATPRPTGSYCFDKNAAGASEYRIFTAYSVGATATRSLSSANVTIDAANVRPCSPGSVAVTAAGKVTWTAPVAGAGCDAARVSFYRVYRYAAATGSGLPAGFALSTSHRHFKTSGRTVTQWTDAARTNKTHYWVSAVDDKNAESVPAGPVN